MKLLALAVMQCKPEVVMYLFVLLHSNSNPSDLEPRCWPILIAGWILSHITPTAVIFQAEVHRRSGIPLSSMERKLFSVILPAFDHTTLCRVGCVTRQGSAVGR